jgi:hypothetical protein
MPFFARGLHCAPRSLLPESMEADQTDEGRPEMLHFANNRIREAKEDIIQKKPR